jgi:hypothetical protein
MGVQRIDKLIAIGRLKAIVKRQDRTRLILIERASLLYRSHTKKWISNQCKLMDVEKLGTWS